MESSPEWDVFADGGVCGADIFVEFEFTASYFYDSVTVVAGSLAWKIREQGRSSS
jgi:hypothetical protein